MIDALHFIRPLWLIALPVILLVWWLVRRRDASQAMVGDFVAPHLREALTINRDARRGLRAVDGVAVALLVTAIAAAYWAHSPVVVITPEAGTMGIGLGGFQEANQLPMFQEFTKYQGHVCNPARMAEFTARCFDRAMAEMGPTQLNIPRDYFYGDIDVEIPRPQRLDRGPGGDQSLNAAADLLAEAEFPVIISGGGVVMADAVEEYLVQLVMATRTPAKFDAELAGWIAYGSSPRGSISLDRCARAHAWLAGRDFVSPEDIQAVLFDVLRHRLILSFEAEAAGIDQDRVLQRILDVVAVA